MAEDLVALWCCDVTGNPVGTDTVAIGQPSCECQGCRAADLIDQQAASLAAKDKEISTLKMALDDETSGISAACRDADTLAAKDAEIKRLGKFYDLAMKSRLEWRHRAEQVERVFTDICEELGCKPDNEVALEVVAALKRALADAVEVMRPFALREMQDIKDEVDNYSARYQSQWFADSLAAARAFVAQHGSDSSKKVVP